MTYGSWGNSSLLLFYFNVALCYTSQEIFWNLGMWETKWGLNDCEATIAVFLIVDVCFANIPDLSFHFLDLLYHLDFFAEESESEEEVTDDSPRGSSDDWSDETSKTSRCCHFCSSNMSWLSFLQCFTGLVRSMIVTTRPLCWCFN